MKTYLLKTTLFMGKYINYLSYFKYVNYIYFIYSIYSKDFSYLSASALVLLEAANDSEQVKEAEHWLWKKTKYVLNLFFNPTTAKIALVTLGFLYIMSTNKNVSDLIKSNAELAKKVSDIKLDTMTIKDQIYRMQPSMESIKTNSVEGIKNTTANVSYDLYNTYKTVTKQ